MKLTRQLTNRATLALSEPGRSQWLELADALRSKTDSNNDASELLKQAWGDLDIASYRSKIAVLAHPVNHSDFQNARDAGVEIKDLITIARGNARFDGKRVNRIFKDSRGGSNRHGPQDRFEIVLKKAMKSAKDNGLRRNAIERIFRNVFRAEFGNR
jgi:hypothetical protein